MANMKYKTHTETLITKHICMANMKYKAHTETLITKWQSCAIRTYMSFSVHNFEFFDRIPCHNFVSIRANNRGEVHSCWTTLPAQKQSHHFSHAFKVNQLACIVVQVEALDFHNC